MILDGVVADDVVVDEGVALGPEVPRLLLGIVGPVLQPRQLVLKVQYIERLFVAQGPVLVLGQHVDELLLLKLSRVSLDRPVGVNLCDRVVTGLLRLHSLVCDLDIGMRHALEFRLLRDVVVHILFPRVVFWVAREEHFVRCSLRYLLVQCCETCSCVCHFCLILRISFDLKV